MSAKNSPKRSACEGAGGNAGLPAVTKERRPSRLSRRDGQFAATPRRAAEVVGTKPLGGWLAFSQPAEQATRTRIWLESR